MATKLEQIVKLINKADKYFSDNRETPTHIVTENEVIPQSVVDLNYCQEWLSGSYPYIKNGDIAVIQDDVIKVTCERGRTADLSKDPIVIIAKKPENTKYYMGYYPATLSSDVKSMIEDDKWFDDEKIIKHICLNPNMREFFPEIVKIIVQNKAYDLLVSEEFYNHHELTEQDKEKYTNTIKEISNFIKSKFNIDELVEDYDKRYKFSNLTGFKYIEDRHQNVYLYLVPENLWECMANAVNNGWAPIIPRWGNKFKYQFNREWTNGCTNTIVVNQEGQKLIPIEQAAMFGAVANITFHVPAGANCCYMRPSEEWEETFIKIHNSFGEIDAKNYDRMQKMNFGRAACADIPMCGLYSDSKTIRYWQIIVHKIKNDWDKFAFVGAKECLEPTDQSNLDIKFRAQQKKCSRCKISIDIDKILVCQECNKLCCGLCVHHDRKDKVICYEHKIKTEPKKEIFNTHTTNTNYTW